MLKGKAHIATKNSHCKNFFPHQCDFLVKSLSKIGVGLSTKPKNLGFSVTYSQIILKEEFFIERLYIANCVLIDLRRTVDSLSFVISQFHKLTIFSHILLVLIDFCAKHGVLTDILFLDQRKLS